MSVRVACLEWPRGTSGLVAEVDVLLGTFWACLFWRHPLPPLSSLSIFPSPLPA